MPAQQYPMKKSSFLPFLLLLLCAIPAYAQKELWTGVVSHIYMAPPYPLGAIVKTDSIGNSLSVVHLFDSAGGRGPNCQLLQASNGKIYGTTSSGGAANRGTLYEYDPVIDSFRVLVNFGVAPVAALPYNGLIEAMPGILYTTAGTGDGGAGVCIYSYNIAADTIHLVATVPSFIYGLTTYQNYVNGPLYKASDGFIYGTTGIYSSCPLSAPTLGAVFRINPATNTFSYVYPFNCTMDDGAGPNGGFVESGGKLYSNTLSGGSYNKGVLFAYDLAAHSFTRKINFSDTTGIQPVASCIKATNGRLYGYTFNGFDSGGTYTETLYEYDVATNSYTRKFGFHNPIGDPNDVGTNPFNKPFQASNNKLYGATERGVFEYDIVADSMRHAATLLDGVWQQFIEICRKPAYRYYTSVYDTVCQGAPFSFDLHCTNAQSFVWSHNGTVDATQTTGILSLTAAAMADTGTWVCTMTNECGTTTPPPIHLAVTSLPAAGTITGGHTVCVGASISLAATVAGGAWSVAATSVATITASGILSGAAPGSSIITYTIANSCGTAYDTALVTVIPAVTSAGIIMGMSAVCVGDTIVLTDTAEGGTWHAANALATVAGGIVTGMAAGTDTIYYTITTACGAATSAKVITIGSLPLAGIITGRDTLCPGDTAMLASTMPGGLWSSSNAVIATISTAGMLSAIAEGGAVISYTVTNTCGSAAAMFAINVLPEATCHTGIDDKQLHTGLEVYPNPNAGTLMLLVHSAANEKVHITVTDVTGRTIRELDIISNSLTTLTIEAPSGIYQLTALTPTGRYTVKLTVM